MRRSCMDSPYVRAEEYIYLDLNQFSDLVEDFPQFMDEIKIEAKKYVNRELAIVSILLKDIPVYWGYIHSEYSPTHILLLSDIRGFNTKLFEDIAKEKKLYNLNSNFHLLNIKDNIMNRFHQGYLSKALDIPDDDIKFKVFSKRETLAKILIYIVNDSGIFGYRTTCSGSDFRFLVFQLSKKLNPLCREILTEIATDSPNNRGRFCYYRRKR